MFENLTERLNSIFKQLKNQGKLTEQDIEKALREVRLALLEADVNFKVVKTFISQVKEKAIGEEVLQSLTPAQQVIKIVNEELINLLGKTQEKIYISSQPPTILMMVGLQGCGKTTTAAKLALYLKKQGHNPLLVAADIQRPAAIKQLEVLGNQISIPVFNISGLDAVSVAQASLKQATGGGHDVIIIDTAGRLHIDEALMQELSAIKEKLSPHEIILVVDAMTGQDALKVAQDFDSRLTLSGIILTKLDGDARGGAALSVRQVTGKPIKMVGTGEKIGALEPFHPERMASRILGMGDVLSLIEKIEATIDKEKTLELEKKIRKQTFTLEDFLDQIKQIKKMGTLDQIMSMIPGLSNMKVQDNAELDGKALKKVEAIISSMTKGERTNPNIINGSRKRRIAVGSGTSVSEVNRLLKQFEDAKKMMKHLTDFEKGHKKGMLKIPFLR